jgi:hypothetical protein
MKVAPHDSCVACYKGDTTTALVISGEAEYVVAGIHLMAGLSADEAAAVFHHYAEQEMGCDPGMVPAGRMDICIRLCRECAAKNGVVVAELKDIESGGAVSGYSLPESEEE